jgi:hypothetical protein
MDRSLLFRFLIIPRRARPRKHSSHMIAFPLSHLPQTGPLPRHHTTTPTTISHRSLTPTASSASAFQAMRTLHVSTSMNCAADGPCPVSSAWHQTRASALTTPSGCRSTAPWRVDNARCRKPQRCPAQTFTVIATFGPSRANSPKR